MELKNAALQELYDTIVKEPIFISPYGSSPIDRAFVECDEKLSGSAIFEHIKNLQNLIDMLQQDHKSDVRVIGKLHSQMVNLEDEKTEQEKRADILKSQRDMLKKELDKANEKNRDLQKDRDTWVRNNGEKQAEIAELKRQLDHALEAEKTVNDSRYKWAQKWLSTKQNLETKLNEAEVKYRRLESQYQELSIKLKRIQVDVGRESRHLWDMLQNVNDIQPNEFDVECESMHDIIGMDLEDFLDAYKKWQDQKETDRMRNWLVDFCDERNCKGCPLESTEYKCGCGYSFKRRDRFDSRIIPDKDIERYYEKARGCGRYTLNDGKLVALPNMEGVNRAITKACESFCEAIRDADIKIKENVPRNYWECTLTANVEVDRDLLEKVCGVKPEEEEHKFEYGDAVRVPWRDYDYMYIGPEEKHIRLFNPMTHEVVFVSPSEKLTYQGCKIVLCDEEDLRKIWKDKK